MKPQMPTQAVHETSVSAEATLAVTLSSFGAKVLVHGKGKSHKANEVSLSLKLRASTPTTWEQTLILTRQ